MKYSGMSFLKIQNMKKLFVGLFFCIPFLSIAQSDLKLWYNKPAEVWTEALPVGNGRIGAMVFGRIDQELIQINEATLWSGGPVQPNQNPDAFPYLAKTRAALAKGLYDSAAVLVKHMQGKFSESFMPMGDILIKQDLGNQAPTQFYRDLNIQDAIATTKYTVNGVNYTREVFSSAPAQVLVIRIKADKAKQLNFTVSTKSLLQYHLAATAKNELRLIGKAAAHADPQYHSGKNPVIYEDANSCRGMRFEYVIKAINTEGTVVTDTSGIHIKNATEVVLLVSAATSFNGFDKCPDKQGKDEHAIVNSNLKSAIQKNFTTLLSEHKADFHHFFNRVSLKFNDPASDEKRKQPTDIRLENYTKTKDLDLEALYFQFGRYLLISSSRTKDVPANLQGIWNPILQPPWSSNYTSNINVEMNYWPVESTNLSELHQPLLGLIKNLSVTGTETAKTFYHARGWVVHHNTDIWAMSNPVGDFGQGSPTWANWYMGANWLSRHLWEHYQFTGDKQFLKEAYPIMKGAALFSLDWLIPDEKGNLITSPATTPENDFYYDNKTKKGQVSNATTMDMGIIRDLFTNMIEAGKELNIDAAFRDTLIATKKKMLPFQIGSKGQLQEWYKDFEDVDPHHRHTSHLYALHPAHEISPFTTPELTEAAKRTLELRGDDGTGWSLGWKVNMWARLLDGNHAYTLYRNLLRLTKENNTTYNKGGGVYPNLFDAHPPFQIDGNFAGTAGVAEMLLQSQNNEIFLLPALPDAWSSGSVKGLVARGNFVTDIDWDQKQLVKATILSRNGGKMVLRCMQPFIVKGLNQPAKKTMIGYTLTLSSEKGKKYELVKQG